MNSERIPDLVIERHRLNELPPGDAMQVREALARDPQLRERLASLEASDRALQPDVDRVARHLAAMDPAPRRRVRPWLIPAIGVVGGVAIAVAVWMPAPATAPPADERIK